MKKNIYLFIIILTCTLRVHASHIVGAQLYYDCLGNNTYLVTLIEYRNCSAGCYTCAGYGDPEYIQIYDTAGHYIDSFAAPYTVPDTISVVDTGACAYPNDYCIEVATFQTTFTLPSIPGGYIVVFQRCCRNNAIINIPANTGATYFTSIQDTTAISLCDNPPRFRLINPSLMPIDTGFTFDMSATDPDGDSLAYRLTNSYDGASPTCPNPSPANGGQGGCPDSASPPPYVSVPYIAPYTITNPTNNPLDSGHLQIDPQTGILSGRVNQTGIFLVAVAADEYRNGVLIGSTLLDFQFIFGGCIVDTMVSSAVNSILKPGIKIYSNGNEAVINFSNENNGVAQISFYDLLGREIVGQANYTGTIYSHQFNTIGTQYLIVRVQLSDGEIAYKKLLIESGN